MTEAEKNVYLNIYDIVEENLSKSGEDMVTYKETYVSSLELDTSFADLSLLEGIPKDKFMQALYYCLFYRWISKDEEAAFNSLEKDEKELKQELIDKVYNSTERVTANRVVSNRSSYSVDGNKKIGKFKRIFIKMIARIKAAIPLSFKIKIKNLLSKPKA